MSFEIGNINVAIVIVNNYRFCNKIIPNRQKTFVKIQHVY